MNVRAFVLGLQLPEYPALVSAGAALTIIFVGWLVAMFAGRTLGLRLATFWEQHGGARETMARRTCDIVRYAATALILAIALRSDAWPPLSSFILGFSLAFATAMLIRTLVRGLAMPKWVALVLAAAAFVALVADAMHGLKPVTDVLDAIALTVGRSRVSLFNIIQIAIILLGLYAAVKLAGRLLAQWIPRASAFD